MNYPSNTLRVQLLFFLFLSITLASCIKEEPTPEEPEIGEIFQGGIVAHVFLPGEPGYVEGETHGMVVAPTDAVFMSQWGCRGQLVTGTSAELGTGRENTRRVVDFHDALPDFYNNPQQCHPNNDGSVAARIAVEFRAATGQQDWFMPSLREMDYLYKNRDKIGGFSVEEYWSSCETNANAACVMSFITGDLISRDKDEVKRVRLIRFF